MGNIKKAVIPILIFTGASSLHAQTNALAQTGPMRFSLILFACLLAAAVFVIIFLIIRKPGGAADELKAMQSENADLRARLNLEAETRTAAQTRVSLREEEIAGLKESLRSVEAKREVEISEMKQRIQDLDKSRSILEAEKIRISSEDLERRQEEEKLRDRLWAVHEREVISRMTEICRKPNILLPCFDNTTLPDDFDPALKPDFLIRLLDQYVIFDAKVSRSQNLQVYLSSQVKKTAAKFNASPATDLIYRQVFFIVPGVELSSLKEISYYEQGYSFFVISLEAFEPVITTLKRLEEYEFADRFDPQEREAIVGLFAAFEQHIRQQNAGNILGTLRGLAVLSGTSSLPGDMAEEVETRRKNIRLETFKPSELKRLIDDPEYQIREIARLVRPAEPDITPGELTSAADEEPNESD